MGASAVLGLLTAVAEAVTPRCEPCAAVLAWLLLQETALALLLAVLLTSWQGSAWRQRPDHAQVKGQNDLKQLWIQHHAVSV